MIRIQEFSGKESKLEFKKISLIHKESISDGFLASLNHSVLIELYKGFAKSYHSKLFVALNDKGDILGFIVLSFSTRKLYKDIIFKRFLLIIPFLLPNFFSFSFLSNIFETLFYPYKDNLQIDTNSELLNFCVSSYSRGQGVGSKLFLKVNETLKEKKINSIKIVTGQNQTSAQKFYEKHEALLFGTQEVHKGSVSLIYKYNTKY